MPARRQTLAKLNRVFAAASDVAATLRRLVIDAEAMKAERPANMDSLDVEGERNLQC